MTDSARSPVIEAESAITLIEFLVYLGFAVVVLAIIGGVLMSSLGIEGNVRSTTEATNLGPLTLRLPPGPPYDSGHRSPSTGSQRARGTLGPRVYRRCA